MYLYLYKTGKLVTTNMEMDEVLDNCLLPELSIVASLPTSLKTLNLKASTGGIKYLQSEQKIRF